MICIENDLLKVEVAELGAEVRSVIHKDTKISYMWNGDAAYWGRVSPVLFPIVGRLKNNQYKAEGNRYELSQHGFLRDAAFKVSHTTKSAVTFTLESNGSFKEIYPYEFRVEIAYQLDNDKLSVEWRVTNLEQAKTMYFSIGAHPAFRLPLLSGEETADYKLQLKPVQHKQVTAYELVDGLIRESGQPTELPVMTVNAHLFENDALVYDHIEEVHLQSDNGNGVAVTMSGFPFVGIWSKYDKTEKTMAPFICIEPWFGIADTVEATGELSEKAGVQQLQPRSDFHSVYTMTFY
ncbi:aldose 1-epimerase family protein [Terribacillus sp. DMT04]|uniref:aldose 1-epimerase family protein n=1 Tax=Terribacillus sp. DMT04 TaxID=2850441 RepID=UPI001C2BD515|nr:aldose 1-epimerase family protein [Terribacillus sp. DMT04]QXE01385.1 aldose 1-epimerase family protein [Terribacillus sp. DMT04]